MVLEERLLQRNANRNQRLLSSAVLICGPAAIARLCQACRPWGSEGGPRELRRRCMCCPPLVGSSAQRELPAFQTSLVGYFATLHIQIRGAESRIHHCHGCFRGMSLLKRRGGGAALRFKVVVYMKKMNNNCNYDNIMAVKETKFRRSLATWLSLPTPSVSIAAHN